MPEQTPVQPAPRAEADIVVRRLREFVSAGIAILIIISAVVMLIQAFNFLTSPEEFDRVKDLLLFINPLLGVVVGYYFNKTTSEARAETAETTAQSAMASAQEAAEARNKAEADADAARSEAQEVKTVLKDVTVAADKMMAQVPAPSMGVLSVDEETGQPVIDPRIEFQMALQHARRFVE
ncbi:MAG: hypothetical protein Kow0063_35000 [Anaerolineae bacterium]